MDCFSNLPDEIVCHILSSLSTKEAALTCVLAKRWRNLFAFSPNLRFEEKNFVYRKFDFDVPCSFRDFLDRVLAVSGNSPVKKFSLKYRQYLVTDHTFRWIRNVMSRGALDRLHIDVIGKGVASLPLDVFTCKTLVKLRVARGFVIATVPENASLPCLKTLFLDQIRFSYHQGRCAFEALLSACPVLEELVLRNVDSVDCKSCTVSCKTLQRLTMYCFSFSPLGPPRTRIITFDTPSLAYLEYFDFVQKAYPIVNFDSLVEAKLDLFSSTATSHSNPENLFKGLSNVQILDLSTIQTMDTIYSFREAIPVFKNLLHLSITRTANKCCRTLPLLLKNSPVLETLVIKGPLHYDEYGRGTESVCNCLSGYSCLGSCSVKVLEITLYGKTILELGQLKHFLNKLSCLELVKVSSWATDEEEKLRLATDLLNLPRSSKCKIQLEFIPPR